MDGADITDTIFALATPPGVGGLAVVRVSGPAADRVLAELTGRALPAPRMAVLRRLLGADGEVIDEALVLRFAAGASYTGEPVVELHCHGSRAVVAALLSRLSDLPGCRLAEPGEFTRRALLNGRLDLAEVEALGDLIASETEAQRRQAIEALSGGLHARLSAWRERLLHVCALVEATIDWADEEVPEDVSGEVDEIVAGVMREIGGEIDASHGQERLREGFEVAVIGPPNCGKSTFINVLAGREAAITSPVAGTTRDVIELRYDLNGLPVIFLDTAGLRETADEVERIGVARARERAERADLRLVFRSGDASSDEISESLMRGDDLSVWNKSDLGTGEADFGISTKRGDGLEPLLASIRDRLETRLMASGVASRERHRVVLRDALSHLARARDAFGITGPEIAADELRAALTSVSRLVGHAGIEDILDRVFASFCLGK